MSIDRDRSDHRILRRRAMPVSAAIAAAATIVLCAAMPLAPAQAQSASPPAAQQAAVAERLSNAQLEQLVAPIALYPDDLMSQVLMASTYPLEVVEAARWSAANPSLTGKALQDALAKQTWDPSVMALATVPQTLQMMNDKLDWTQQLGDAFLAQQQDVLDAVQRLRARADAAGQLKTTPQQKVTKASPPPSAPRSAGSAQVAYVIEPATPGQYYVPIYDPNAVYGPWPYAEYAPFYWYPPGYVAGNVFSFAAGVAVGAAIWGNVDWWRRDVNINVNRYNQFNRTHISDKNWSHDPKHRGSVPYRNRDVASKFGDGGKAASRDAFRGKAEAGQKNLAKQGAAAGGANLKDKAGGANKTALDKKAAGNKAALDKKAGGNKAAVNKQAGSKKAAAAERSKQAGPSKQAGIKKAAAKPRPAKKPQVARGGGNFKVAGGGGGGRARGGGRRR